LECASYGKKKQLVTKGDFLGFLLRVKALGLLNKAFKKEVPGTAKDLCFEDEKVG
jgi:hypothetical protein